MASATKAARAVQASATNTAGSTTTGAAVNNTTALGATLTAKCVNGATGPTLGCRFRVQVSNDNSTWYDWSAETAPVTNSLTHFYQPVILPPDIMYYRSVFDSNTGQSTTVQCDAAELSSIA